MPRNAWRVAIAWLACSVGVSVAAADDPTAAARSGQEQRSVTAPSPSAHGTVSGRIHSAEGAPLPGAFVFVHSARPVSGPPLQCPTCYVECGRSTRTGADGRFQLPRMSRDLRFRLLVLADGHQPGWVLDVAPDAAPLEDTLRARPARGNAVAVPFRGRLVDLAGSPIAGAVVTPLGFSRRNSQFFGQIEFVDPLAISDSSGAFAFDASDSCTGLTLLVQARTKAPRTIVDLRPQRDSVVVLEDGAMVSGRVLRQGRAAAGIALGLTPVDRGADSFTSPDTIGTNAQGEFLFTNVPAGQDYVLYALSETTAPLALQSSLVTVGDAGTMRRLPDLSLGKGHVLRGRVVMSQGGSVPPGVQVTVMRSLTNQAMRLRPGPSGEFVVEGLPTETVRVNCWLDGYRIGAGSTGQLGDPRRGVRVALQRDTDVVLSLEPSRQK